ncbi:MAG: efflux RND transporter periplasmic adaptor subunit [Bryobacteraceae bacterium]
MQEELKSLRIDRTASSRRRSRRPVIWLLAVLLFGAAAARYGYGKLFAAREVEVVRVAAADPSLASEPETILNATGYIVAAHRIEVASKVVGRVAWIGVDKGDQVKQGDVIVRLEDDEYQAQLQQARGQLASLEARLNELLNGSRPEEIAMAKANAAEARAQLENARVTLERTRNLVKEGVLAAQALDDAQARYDAQAARLASLERSYELVRTGPRQEQIEAMRGQVEQARGAVRFYETQVANTIIKAPVSGTILERAVEKGEFVTTSFVGDRGAKGYAVSLADLNDLEVELDISQSDFAKLKPRQRGLVTTDAYPDRKYEGIIDEISPEANRQKATVQIKVKILKPDGYLRPEMNASVTFVGESRQTQAAARPAVVVPASAIRGDTVYLALDGRAVRRPVRTAGRTSQGIRIDGGLSGGEEIILNPSADLADGSRIRPRKGQRT